MVQGLEGLSWAKNSKSELEYFLFLFFIFKEEGREVGNLL